MIISHLRKNNVNLELIQRTNDQTTVAFVSNKKKNQNLFFIRKIQLLKI